MIRAKIIWQEIDEKKTKHVIVAIAMIPAVLLLMVTASTNAFAWDGGYGGGGYWSGARDYGVYGQSYGGYYGQGYQAGQSAGEAQAQSDYQSDQSYQPYCGLPTTQLGIQEWISSRIRCAMELASIPGPEHRTENSCQHIW